MRSKLLVLGQFIGIFMTFHLGSSSYSFLHYTLLLSGISLGLWAIFEKRFSVNIFPVPTNQMDLIRTGPYKYIRHPMYTSVLLTTLSWSIQSMLAFIVWILLVLILLMKINYEEKLLIKTFTQYPEYKMNSNKLIPYIF